MGDLAVQNDGKILHLKDLRGDFPRVVYQRSQKLRSVFDVNRLQAKLVNLCLMGKLDEVRATKISYMLSLLVRGLEVWGSGS